MIINPHVNGVRRATLNNQSAYDIFTFVYIEELAKLLGISPINPKNIIQSLKLIQHKPSLVAIKLITN